MSRLGEDFDSTIGLPFDAEDLEARLTWIWGSPRCGSTWLLRQLTHPARISAKFDVGFEPPPGRAEPLKAVPVDEFLVANHIAPVSGAPIPVEGAMLPATLNNYQGKFPAYAFSERFRGVWEPELRRLVLVRLAALLDAAESNGFSLAADPALVIKEVNGTHAADLVMRLFPRSRMIVLVRDPRDVIDSRLHAYSEGGWLTGPDRRVIEGERARLDFVREAAAEWSCAMDAAGRARDAHDPACCRVMSYEQLRAEPVGQLDALFEWMGIDHGRDGARRVAEAHALETVPEERRGPDRPIRAAQPGLWREHLSDNELGTAEEVLGERIESWGYRYGRDREL